MNLTYFDDVDVADVELDGRPTPGRGGGSEQIDQDRIVRYAADDRIVAYEFLNARRHGVRLDDLEHRDELRALFREAGFSERDWGTPIGAGRRIGGKTRAAG